MDLPPSSPSMSQGPGADLSDLKPFCRSDPLLGVRFNPDLGVDQPEAVFALLDPGHPHLNRMGISSRVRIRPGPRISSARSSPGPIGADPPAGEGGPSGTSRPGTRRVPAP